MTRTRQEIFDIAYRGLKSQGFRRSTNGRECRYRGPSGLRCAVGHLIAPENYKRRFEGQPASDIAILAAANVTHDDATFLEDLQKCHDRGGSSKMMQANLYEFAQKHGLTIPEGVE